MRTESIRMYRYFYKASLLNKNSPNDLISSMKILSETVKIVLFSLIDILSSLFFTLFVFC